MLNHPADLVAWRRWHESRHSLRSKARSARSRLWPVAPTRVDLFTSAGTALVLVAVEAAHTSVDRAVVAPLAYLPAERTAIVAPRGWQPPTTYVGHTRRTVSPQELATLVTPRAVLAAGHYTEIGSVAFEMAEKLGLPFFVAQHGALTPFAPPLPRSAHLLAWSEADGGFWIAGRKDVTVTTVGSQLLWAAAGPDTGAIAPSSTRRSVSGTLTYLGQGHAAEISRSRLAHAALTTCRQHGAVYRPHPSERDVTSRAVLATYRWAGITIDATGAPLVDLEAPVISVFSTGVLEAAARGREAWVDFPRPPAWLSEFWERYGMHRLGTSPTPAPAPPQQEPARRVAEIVIEAAS